MFQFKYNAEKIVQDKKMALPHMTLNTGAGRASYFKETNILCWTKTNESNIACKCFEAQNNKKLHNSTWLGFEICGNTEIIGQYKW